MANLRKYLQQPAQHPYPHAGRLLQKGMAERRISVSEVAQHLDIAGMGVYRYFRQPSLQSAVLWKAGLAIGHNFFAELAHAFPIQPADADTDTKLAEKDRRIAELEKELAIYKEIVLARQ